VIIIKIDIDDLTNAIDTEITLEIDLLEKKIFKIERQLTKHLNNGKKLSKQTLKKLYGLKRTYSKKVKDLSIIRRINHDKRRDL
jgi:hypothetical protein